MGARNANWFDIEIEKLEHWAEDRRATLKAELDQLDESLKLARRSARTAPTLPEKLERQREVRGLDRWPLPGTDGDFRLRRAGGEQQNGKQPKARAPDRVHAEFDAACARPCWRICSNRQIAAAAATFSDSAGPGMGMCT